jgi:two-component system, LytTR family, sensor kinase
MTIAADASTTDPARSDSAGADLSPMSRAMTTRLVVGVWTAYGLFFAVQMFFAYRGTYRPVSLPSAFGSQMLAAWIWALGTLWIIRVSRRWPIDRVNWKHRLLLHGLFCILFTVVSGMAHSVTDTLFFRGEVLKLDTFRAFVFMADREINIYWAVVFTTLSYDYFWRFRNVQLRAIQLQAELANARLDLLTAQIHPHFLFNTLNTISTVIREDVDAADRMIANLGQFLRATLAQSEASEVTLRQELELLDCYLQIQKARFEDELQLEFDIAPDVLELLVPTLVLQPLTENAMKHGLSAGRGTVDLRIAARRDGDKLLLQVRDRGDATSAAGPGLGVGLSNTRMRLKHMYGREQSLDFDRRPDHGCTVTVRIPVRETGGQAELPVLHTS